MIPNSGRVVYLDADIGGLDRRAMLPYRIGLQMVFQDPYGSLSPRMTVGEIVTEGLLVHAPGLDTAERARRAAEALSDVGLEPAVRDRFPHVFSGDSASASPSPVR